MNRGLKNENQLQKIDMIVTHGKFRDCVSSLASNDTRVEFVEIMNRSRCCAKDKTPDSQHSKDFNTDLRLFDETLWRHFSNSQLLESSKRVCSLRSPQLIMSKMLTRTTNKISHIGRDTCKFQFDITIHEITHLPSTASTVVVQCNVVPRTRPLKRWAQQNRKQHTKKLPWGGKFPLYDHRRILTQICSRKSFANPPQAKWRTGKQSGKRNSTWLARYIVQRLTSLPPKTTRFPTPLSFQRVLVPLLLQLNSSPQFSILEPRVNKKVGKVHIELGRFCCDSECESRPPSQNEG